MYLQLVETKKEPKETMNSMLEILVSQLVKLDKEGVTIDGEHYYVRLFNIVADDPGM